MRVMLSTLGSRGDVQPLVALGAHLKALGHEVRACVPPDFREWIESLDIPVTPIGPELRTLAASDHSQSQTSATPLQRQQMAAATVATQFKALIVAAHGCDIIVAASARQIAARSVAEKMGISYVFVAYSPPDLPFTHHPPPPVPLPGQTPPSMNGNRELWARIAARFNDLFRAALNDHRASLGLVPVSDAHSHMLTDQPWLAADPVLGPWPDPAGRGVFQTGAWILPDERPLSPQLETFLERGELPIYFGFGSIPVPHDTGQVMLQAARALGRRAIVSRGWFDVSLVDNEADCLSIGEVNVRALFRRVAAVVHHGGAGTTIAAALAGTPQVVIPVEYDQRYWARRVHTLGIGTAHGSGMPTTESLTSALERTLRPDVATRARSVATAVRRDGTQVAAERLIAR